MDSEEITFVLCSIDRLTRDNHELRARLEALEQTTETLWIPSAVSKCNGVENETKPNGLALLCGNDATDLLSKKRLNEIRRDITTFKSTWSDLRQLYPPRHSDFAPLKEFDDDLDGTLSQAATMAAYGVELLHIALSCTPVDRGLATQTYQMLATLCATLIDTRDQQRCSRDVIINSEFNDAHRHKRAKQDIGFKPCQQEERPGVSARNKRKIIDHWDDSDSELTDMDSVYSRQEPQQCSIRKRQSYSAYSE
ncbi:hypothetical protein GGI13_000654 [Coemansia sp. RSA 455]|nr:hypothetical protein GGI08_001144 [Coemansia sp. S2]KAJ2075114.1 hypothetical protein GGH13_000845 [Coemansia sp. S155-1]KAJ2102850.1 hypothetical protein GGI09_000993 [Coemansia sp. S100]KAJ2110742.1 hypothetical protein GGI16_000160 [Coemansia sp. S142-1]KAJ2118061.1 hypothetical protein IW146_000197 [Coemansia sp. RSA 922]KAJ2258269.1 hypothetical protein GGI13_000654 [Coemansia sp. RSA 455]KAJ2354243.1 hypothetical protein GGH92_000159 [Coemansia sp. RSA 2673]KAJ2466285.1 hypothetical